MNLPIEASRYDNVNQFVNQLAPIILNEVARRKANGTQSQYVLPSIAIAQAGLESGWNINASTLYGIKGEGVELDTSEYINGEYINIKDSFACYPSIAGAVQGYFDLLDCERYTPVCYAIGYAAQAEQLSICGYATDPTYKIKLVEIIDNFNLTMFDEIPEDTTEEVSEEEPEGVTEDTTIFEVGDVVSCITDEDNCLYDTNGTYCKCWFDEYTIIETNDENSVLSYDGEVFGRFNNCDLRGI